MAAMHNRSDRRMRASGGLSWWLACLLVLVLITAKAPAQTSQEYQLKAVFLTKFAGFVTWPKDTFPTISSPIVIAVVGEDPFGRALDEAVKGESVGGRPLLVSRVSRLEEALDSHIVYISRSERRGLDEMLAALAGRSILTVSETRRFAEDGGMINFFLSNGRVRFEINPKAAEKAGLILSSKLLKVGTIVGG